MKNFLKTYILTLLMATFVLVTCYPALAQNDVEEIADFSLQMDDVDGEQINVNQIEIDEFELDSGLQSPPSDDLTPIANSGVAMDNEPVVQDIPYSGTYYDASSITSESLTNITAPRQVDPRYEPGSSFVVVQKSAPAGSAPARIVAAQRALNLGRYGAALELYEGLYSETPKNEQVLMGLAVAQQKSGFTESAIATYEELLKINPDNTNGMVNMLGLLKSQYPSVAFRRLRELWQENPSNAYIAGELGLLTASMGQPKQALTYLGAASSLEPNNASHYYNMAVINDQAGQVASAIELYQKALQVDIAYGAGRTIERDTIYDRLATLRRL